MLLQTGIYCLVTIGWEIWRGGRVWLNAAVLKTAEGFMPSGGSNPSPSAIFANFILLITIMIDFCAFAPVAQLDRAADYESVGWRFESSQARHFFIALFPVCKYI